MNSDVISEYTHAKKIFIVVSLKGGVAKSTTASSIAYWLASKRFNYRIGLWDMDITSPSIPKILKMQGMELEFAPNGKLAAMQFNRNLSVMSVDFFLPSSDQPIVFDESKKKTHMIQFLKSVEFGECDIFVFDTPPTTSPELLTILNLFPPKNISLVIVSQPGDASSNAAKKSIKHLKATGLPISGIICTMNGHTCKNCGTYDPIFPNPVSIEDMAKKYGIPYLGDVELGTVIQHSLRPPVYEYKYFKKVLNNLVNNKPVKFKPMSTDIPLFKKAMIVKSMDRNLNKMLKKKKTRPVKVKKKRM